MRIDRSTAGNALVLVALCALAAWLLRLQAAPWPGFTPLPAPRAWAALATVLFLMLCGWTAWRARKAHVAPEASGDHDVRAWQVVYASQTGFAFELAERTAIALREAGQSASVRDIATLDADALHESRCLFIASTTGEGDPPDHALGFAHRAMALGQPDLHGMQYAVLALGDRNYAQFCAFGRQLDEWLRHHGAQPLFDRVEVDNADPPALRHWQAHVGAVAGSAGLADWTLPQYQPWTLVERRLLNPGSAGAPAFHIALQSPSDTQLAWQAGDIAEIKPDAAAAREYSIASIPADGRVELLVRLMQRADGTPGVASGWLCTRAAIGDAVALRLRANPNFHAPHPARPLILIGNGTGLAGLRAHIKARIAAGASRNWLLFGERNAAHDSFHGDELEAWLQEGALSRLDRVFSRDGHAQRYVQDAVRANAALLREWLDHGAAIYVCGNLQGMAPGVDDVLVELLGRDGVDALTEAGRYRRDVY